MNIQTSISFIRKRVQLEKKVLPNYDLAQFNLPIFDASDLSNMNTTLKDGIYHCKRPEKLDFYISRFEGKSDTPVIFVCFNAAVGNRPSKCAPFFSGKGVAKTLNLPLIAISDPFVSATDLCLAWYAGYEKHQTLQKDIAHFLDRVATKYRAKLILYGGSGGGFASLAIAKFLQSDATLIVSNPQTSISKYLYSFARDYVAKAFPSIISEKFGETKISAAEKIAELYETLEKSQIVHDVTKMEIPKNSKVLYLQNKSDSHVATHAVPFMKNREWKVIGMNSLLSQNIGLYFGSWGKGHVGPSANIVAAILEKIIQNESVESVLNHLENGLDGLNPNKDKIVFLNNEQYKLYPTIRVTGKHVIAECSLKRTGLPFHDDGLSYAFYLMDGAKRIATRHYSKDPKCQFDRPLRTSQLTVRCFVRDKFNQIISARSEKK